MKALTIGLVLAVLAAPSKTYQKDLHALLEHLGDECLLLGEKKVKWKKVSAEARKRLKKVDSDADFYGLLCWVVGQLRDTHAHVKPRDGSLPAKWHESQPKELQVPMSVMPGALDLVLVSGVDESLEGRGVEAGMVLHTVDGEPARDWFEARSQERFLAGGNSTIHRTRTETYSCGVVMPEGGKMRLEFRSLALSKEEKEKYVGLSERKRAAVLNRKESWRRKEITVSSGACGPARLRGHGFPCWIVGDRVELSAATAYAKLPSGFGYVYLRNIDGKTQAENLMKAFAALDDCPGLVLDMRWNGGGGGEGVVTACFPGKGKSEDGSSWTRPVAVLIGPRVMSSGDSVAFWLKNTHRHELFGEHTSGASGPKGSFELPSGFAQVGYVRSHWRSRSLEGVGVAPTVRVQQDVVELSLGIDSVLAAAERHLRKVTR